MFLAEYLAPPGTVDVFKKFFGPGFVCGIIKNTGRP
jgi:hypothetical protein